MAKNVNSKNQTQTNSGTNWHDSVQNVSTKSKNKNSSKASNSSKNSGMENTHTSNAYSVYNEEE